MLNNNLPNEYPCCTPSSEDRMNCPNTRDEGDSYDVETWASDSGSFWATVSINASRCTVLNAFEVKFEKCMSCCSRIQKHSSGVYLCLAPYRTPTLNCLGARSVAHRFATIDPRRRNVKPTAIGRKPPSFFRNAWRFSYKKDVSHFLGDTSREGHVRKI